MKAPVRFITHPDRDSPSPEGPCEQVQQLVQDGFNGSGTPKRLRYLEPLRPVVVFRPVEVTGDKPLYFCAHGPGKQDNHQPGCRSEHYYCAETDTEGIAGKANDL